MTTEETRLFKTAGEFVHGKLTPVDIVFVLVAVVEGENGPEALAVTSNTTVEACVTLLEMEAAHLRKYVLRQGPDDEGIAGHA